MAFAAHLAREVKGDGGEGGVVRAALAGLEPRRRQARRHGRREAAQPRFGPLAQTERRRADARFDVILLVLRGHKDSVVT